MSGTFTFSDNQGLDTTVLVEEAIVWNQDNCNDVQNTVDYVDNDETILTDAISESYVTADEDEENTQYFSVLESSSQTILDDMSITIENAKDVDDSTEFHENNDEENIAETTNLNGNDVMLYSVPGDGLYGIQIAEDEDGNLQKFQFKLRLVMSFLT